MPLTTLDATAALIVIDLQKGITGVPAAHPIAGVLARNAELTRAFRQRNLPVVLVNVAGAAPGRTDAPRRMPANLPSDWAELVAELDPQPTDIRITKHAWGAFSNTTLDATLRQRGVTQVFITGISTSIGVETTARDAYGLGYNVVLVTDAMTDREATAHQYSIENIFPRLGETDTTSNILKRLTE